MEPVGPTADSFDVSGAVDIKVFVQMLAGQARQNTVAILDAAMPAPALNGIRTGLHFMLLLRGIKFGYSFCILLSRETARTIFTWESAASDTGGI